MIQIQAATRIKVMAKADQAQARAYFKSFGITVGALQFNGTGGIDFQISPKDATKAKAALTKKFGKPVIESKPGADVESMYFPLDDKQDRSIYLEIRKHPQVGRIGLTDNSDT